MDANGRGRIKVSVSPGDSPAEPRVNTDRHGLQNDTLPSKFRVFEIENETYPKACDPEVVDHLSSLDHRDIVDRFGVDDDLIENDQVRNIFSDINAFVINRESLLLLDRDGSGFELYDERILVEPIPKLP